jgi:hypothetical protein
MLMSLKEQVLWDKIRNFSFDREGIAFTFSMRLARDNGWSRGYALRVVEEYKKFLFLCCVAQHGVTPSDSVDQAWHLHLTYTKSYWTDLCANTLEKEIHHNPTEGGKQEAFKFDSFYTETSQLYKIKFGEDQPGDIWQNNHTRFSDVSFRRINLKKYWLVRKPSTGLQRSLVVYAIVFTSLLSIQATFDASSLIIIGVIIFMAVMIIWRSGSGNGSGCSAGGCSHNHSGCGSGCSGCGGGE